MGFVKFYLATILNDFKELSVPTYENLVRALLDSKNPQLLCRRPGTIHSAHMTCLSGEIFYYLAERIQLYIHIFLMLLG